MGGCCALCCSGQESDSYSFAIEITEEIREVDGHIEKVQIETRACHCMDSNKGKIVKSNAGLDNGFCSNTHQVVELISNATAAMTLEAKDLPQLRGTYAMTMDSVAYVMVAAVALASVTFITKISRLNNGIHQALLA